MPYGIHHTPQVRKSCADTPELKARVESIVIVASQAAIIMAFSTMNSVGCFMDTDYEDPANPSDEASGWGLYRY